ncbi:MAG TPA: matrixin family metalloprotease [Pyrinomonadaceae bacterium]|jgi:hypothetical protein
MSSNKSASKKRASSGDSELKICFDRGLPQEYKPQVSRDRALLVESTIWPKGHRELRCKFLDGSAKQKKKVEDKAHLWELFANVRFKFVASGDAEIRISFTAGQGSWSALGTVALLESEYPKDEPTMNFGWLKANTEDEEYERVVLHEFGHALGLDHEHQNPNAELKWNIAEVKRVYSGPPNRWSFKDIEVNILQKYSPAGVKATRYDPDSIMLYMFPASLFLEGEGTKLNYKLSRMDKEFIRKTYP